MKEKLIVNFDLPLISFKVVEIICNTCYRKTGNKCWVTFDGSKGYLDNIEIYCEGTQKAINRLTLYDLRTKTGQLRKIQVNIYHSEKEGIRISTGEDSPREILTKEDPDVLVKTNADGTISCFISYCPENLDFLWVIFEYVKIAK